jgi:ADP-ribose pyrophosphatase
MARRPHDTPTAPNPAIRNLRIEVLSDAWFVLRRATFEQQADDGSWIAAQREAYDRGNGAAALLHDPARNTILLVRQYRLPVHLNDHPDGMLLEVPAGLLDDDENAEQALRRELEEEVGHRVGPLRRLFRLYMSPGSVTEHLTFFAGNYDRDTRTSAGGGDRAEGEHLDVVELTLEDAARGIETGQICDAKSVLLIQWMRLQATAGDRPLQVLIAGPVRGGTNDEPDKIAANVHAMEVVALDVLQRGHLPIVGEWISFPLMARAGSTRIGDDVYDQLQHPIGERIVECSDVCLRIGGASAGSDRMVALARRLGRLVLTAADQLPVRPAVRPAGAG